MKRRVVITGSGIVSPIGNSVEIFRQSIFSGKSGVGPITQFDAKNLTIKIAAECSNFDVAKHFQLVQSRTMDRYTQFALVAANQAIIEAKFDQNLNKNRVGVVVGSGIGGIHTFELQHTNLMKHGPRRVSPYFIPMLISDIAAGQISIKHGYRGPNYSVNSACATATHAIGIALRHIQFGDADLMITGGAEATISELAIAGFANMRALSPSNRPPKEVSRPFDIERDGFVIGEGAGVLVLEELEHATNRGATILAELVGLGFSADAHHITSPEPHGAGAILAMQTAINDAKIYPDEIDYINAHGTSTPLNDKIETAAIRDTFNRHAMHVSISSTKSMTGHLLGAAGGVEMIAGIAAIQENKIPPTINYNNPDPECDLDYTPNISKSKPVQYVMSNTFGFGGHNASIIIKKFDV